MKPATRVIYSPVMACFVLMIACSQNVPVPVEIESSDMCASCRMAISEMRYAAEMIDKQGEAYKFDDVGCLKNYAQSKHLGENDATWFAVDFETKKWLNAQQASFVRSAQFKTPMSGGIVAVRERTRAEQLASQTEGIVLKFSEILRMTP